MEVDQAPEMSVMGIFDIPRDQLTRNIMDMNAPYQPPVMRELTPTCDTMDKEAMDDTEEGELGYKKIKRGHHSGHKIQVTGDVMRNRKNEDNKDEDDVDKSCKHLTSAPISWGGFVRMWYTYLHLV